MYGVKMVSSVIMFTPDFVKMNQLVQNLNREADTQQQVHSGSTVISKAHFILKRENRF
jgi:hypothetical protein